MSSVNKVILVGNAGKDPETRSFANGGKVVNLTLATSERWKDKASGEVKEKTEWHNVVIRNEKIGEVAERFVRKGSKIYVEGSIATRKYQGSDGQDRYITEIVVGPFRGELVLLDKRDAGEAPAERTTTATPRPARPPARQQSALGSGSARDLDDDVPF